jgi:AcrR family transcriptional regulator
MTDPVKRKYRSPRREAAAAATRARIRQAAAGQFVANGYVATTMRGIAAAAGVGERTLYDTFSTKSELFSHTLGVAIVGDERPIPVADRPEVRRTIAESNGNESITQAVAYLTDLLERAGDLIMVSVEAMGADPDMRVAADAGAQATHEQQLELTTALHGRGALRDGLDPSTAADIMYVLCSPHTHQLLRRHRGWPVEQYRAWLERTLIRELLGQD